MLSKRPEGDVARRRPLLERATEEYRFIVSTVERLPFKVFVQMGFNVRGRCLNVLRILAREEWDVSDICIQGTYADGNQIIYFKKHILHITREVLSCIHCQDSMSRADETFLR